MFERRRGSCSPLELEWALLPDEVHQAVGMIVAQLGVDPPIAALHLRAHAAAHSQDVLDVALDVVAGRWGFDDPRV